MAPPKKSNKKGDDNDDAGLEKIAQLQLRVKALEMKYIEETDIASMEKAKENESQIRVIDLENDLKKVNVLLRNKKNCSPLPRI